MAETKQRAPGAGRPREGVGRTAPRTITISPEDAAFLLHRYGTNNLSAAIRAAVRELREVTDHSPT